MIKHQKYEHLLVSKDGQIFSLKSHKFLKTFHTKKGYEVFSTRLLGRMGKSVLLRVHRLVAETYLDNILNKPAVNHKDGNKSNNNVDNLEWVTAKENTQHAILNGLCSNQSKNNNPSWKGTEGLLQQASELKKSGLSYRKIGKSLGVGHMCIRRWGI